MLQLKKINDTISFPPKRVRNSQPKVLELRRAALENYIIKMLHLSETKQQVLEFLGIESCKNTNRITPKRYVSLIKKHLFFTFTIFSQFSFVIYFKLQTDVSVEIFHFRC